MFQGFSATALRDAPYAGLYLAVYEKSKTSLGNLISRREENRRLEEISKNLGLDLIGSKTSDDDGRGSTLVVSLSGVIAGATSTLLTHPFDILKTRMQIQDGALSKDISPTRGPDRKKLESSRSQQQKKFRPTLLSTFKHISQTDGSKAFLDGLGLRMARKALSGAIGWSIFEGGRGWWVKNQNEKSRIEFESSNGIGLREEKGGRLLGDGVENRI